MTAPARSWLRKQREKKWVRVAAQAVLIVAIYLGIRAYQTRAAARGHAPPLSGTTTAGQMADLSSLKEGPVLVHFWATWCGVCRLEQGSIDSVAEDYPVLTVASRSGPTSAVASYLKDQGLSFPAIADTRGLLAQDWGVNAFPTTFVVDEAGTIRHLEVGFTSELGLRARLWLASF
jgi:thiol-disulfide isomerase/thioredoxin